MYMSLAWRDGTTIYTFFGSTLTFYNFLKIVITAQDRTKNIYIYTYISSAKTHTKLHSSESVKQGPGTKAGRITVKIAG